MNTCSGSPSSLAAVARLHNLGGGDSVCTNRHFYADGHGCPDRSISGHERFELDRDQSSDHSITWRSILPR